MFGQSNILYMLFFLHRNDKLFSTKT